MAWVTLLLSFTVDYLCADARRGWAELEFPRRERPGDRSVSDYLYFASAVSTTFGM